ncbi:hypothetical protein Pelo_16514 [Pelomyxa schiedti]|nr:hypothetical protein Pelo_16514 [Pelomyxa schiedti]
MPLPPAFTGRANASTTVQLSPHFRPHLLPPQQTQSIYSPPTAAQPPAVYGYTQFPQQQPILPPPQQFAPPKQTVQRKQTLPPAVPSCAQPTPIPQQQQQHQQQPPLPSQLETHPEQESLPLQLPKDPGKEEIREVHVKYPCDLNSTVSTATCLPMDLPDASADVASNIARERTVLGAFDELGKLIGPAKAAYQKIYPTLPATFYCEVTTLSSFFEALDRILMTTQTSSTQSVVSCRSTPSPTIEETHTHPSPEQSPSTAAPPQPLYRESPHPVHQLPLLLSLSQR